MGNMFILLLLLSICQMAFAQADSSMIRPMPGALSQPGLQTTYVQPNVSISGPIIHYDQVTYNYVGDGGKCPPNMVVVGAGGWYHTYTAGYVYCAPYY